MSPSTLQAKVDGRCTYPGCTADAAADTCLCQPHVVDARSRKRRHRERQRPARRSRGTCADCGRPSAAYRCVGGCVRRQLEMRL